MMSKIKARNYVKSYELYLFPEKITDGQFAYEIGTEREAHELVNLISGFMRTLKLPLEEILNLKERAANTLKNGAPIAALNVDYVSLPECGQMPTGIELDLNYLVERKVSLYAGNCNITNRVSKNKAYRFIAEKIFRDLYTYHEKWYLCSRKGDEFIEELYLMDSVEMVMGQASMDITIDRPLRDYLVSLNKRLKISA
jgi:hypothetical protein